MSDFTPTAEQQAALEAYATGEDLIIEAGAGTGKTATLKLLAESDPSKRMQYIAFNKAIVTEAGKTMPKNVSARTAHSLAFRAVGYMYKPRLESDRMKSSEIAMALGIKSIRFRGADGTSKTLDSSYLAGLVMRTITNFCQSAEDEPSADHVPHIKGIDGHDENGQPLANNNTRVRKRIMSFVEEAWADLIKTEGRLQFKHEHYLKIYQLSRPHIPADVILFDEAQDVAPVLAAIVGCQTHAQRVYVGDANQAIYGFTGAVDAMRQLDAEHRTSLTKSFRFGPEIAVIANRVLSQLPTSMVMRGFEQIHSSIGEIEEPDAVLCRTNAMAVATLFSEGRSGRSGHLVGGGREVIQFAKGAKALKDGRKTWFPDLACFSTWEEVQEYVEQDEQGDELKLMVDLVDRFTPGAIINALERMPSEKAADVVISTAHKAKGRQWGAVRLADDFPPENPGSEEGPSIDELRLIYVAITRARLELDARSIPWVVSGLQTAAPEPMPSLSEGVPTMFDKALTVGARS